MTNENKRYLNELTPEQLTKLYDQHAALRRSVRDLCEESINEDVQRHYGPALYAARDYRIGYGVSCGIALGEPGAFTTAMSVAAEHSLAIPEDVRAALELAEKAYEDYMSAEDDELPEHKLKFRERKLAAKVAGAIEALYDELDDDMMREYLAEVWAECDGRDCYVKLEDDGGFSPVIYYEEVLR